MSNTNGYICFYRGKQIEIHASTPFDAQEAACAQFQAMFKRNKVKRWDVTAMLAEVGTNGGTRKGEQVTTVLS